MKRVLAYETLSETDFSLRSDAAFRPNSFADLSSSLERPREMDGRVRRALPIVDDGDADLAIGRRRVGSSRCGT